MLSKKSMKIKVSNADLKSTRGSRFNPKCDLALHQRGCHTPTNATRGSCSMSNAMVVIQTRVWVALCLNFNTSLWATCFNSNASLQASRFNF